MSIAPPRNSSLEQVAKQAGIASLPIVAGEKPLQITERALKTARLEGYDVSAARYGGTLAYRRGIDGRTASSQATGQSAGNLAGRRFADRAGCRQHRQNFHEQIGVTGIILTRIDGDGRGGAALSMRAVTGQPIKFMGTGEKLDEFEEFHPARIASRILDMGDIVSLVEKAAENVTQADAEKMAAKLHARASSISTICSISCAK